ncbi:DUF6916 family protein [Arenimonas terrae]|jgi:hypothetical protein|uniref:DUF6916 domain-containing protein n=1 Tax=Arenimonas terrae TaxID=2546226 RepID=A0A5C4RPK3_9GAMM|nr:hypothetical protein [Arenimonas terrae]TNJ32875.1 hypothetical protein E1B00_14275 [Arenimonas terrae]
MQLMTLEQFAGCLNETFRVALNDGEVDFVLVEAQPLKQSAPGALRAPFSLLFLNTAALVFPQQLYPMKHPRLGEFSIFIVPIARNKDGFIYQAVFN